MATLGGVTCDYIRGTPPGLKEVTEYWRVSGFDGYAAQALGQGGGEFNLVLENIDTPTNNDTWIAAIEALQSTVVSLVFASGDWYGGSAKTFSNLLISSMEPARRRAVSQGSTVYDYAVLMVAGVVTS